uniref:NADH-ubiquinone oxidoreductase chain 6 n=1 Tax=Ischnosoma splendidum TaxID=1143197 RepID=A0A0S2M7T3_9COLE|nr:NADH deshydrogenase subunit 6 [Ischnosoma splendidum]
MIMMSISLMSTLLFLFMKHPLSMSVILLIQTTSISLISGFMFKNFWFSYILFLIMIGGMLVLFIYMTSIASNEKFNFSFNLWLMSMIIMLLIMITIFYLEDYSIFNNLTTENINDSNYLLLLSKFINFPMNMIMIMMIIYLFITLIAVVKISNFKFGPLRQKN